MRYTWAQFTAYRALAQRQKAAAQRNQLVLLNAAFSGGKAALELKKSLDAAASGL